MQQLSDEEFYQQLKKEKTVTNITVSPFDPHFRSHIEKGVWSLVSTLLTKNYYPVSSCEGHEKEKLLYITLAFGELFLFCSTSAAYTRHTIFPNTSASES